MKNLPHLVQLELKKANETFEEIEILTKANKWNGATNSVSLCISYN